VIGLWGSKVEPGKTRERLRCKETDQIVRSLAEIVEQIAPLVQTMTAAGREAAAATAKDDEAGRDGGAGERRPWRGGAADDPARRGAE
jgi:hypothetical protein